MENVERLIIDLKESFEREIHALRDRMDRRFDEVNTRFDTQSLRMDRHGALLQTGSRWTNRMTQWSERVDRSLEAKDLQIGELSERIRRLEDGHKSE